MSPDWVRAAKSVMLELLAAKEVGEVRGVTPPPGAKTIRASPPTGRLHVRTAATVAASHRLPPPKRLSLALPPPPPPNRPSLGSRAALASPQRRGSLSVAPPSARKLPGNNSGVGGFKGSLHLRSGSLPRSSSNTSNNGSSGEESPSTRRNPMRGASEPRLGGGVGGAAAVAAEVSLAVQLEEEVLSLVRQHNPEKENEMLRFFDK